MATSSPARVEADGAVFQVETPTWFTWQKVLERAVRADGQVDAGLLIQAALQHCVRLEDGRRLSEAEILALGTQVGDRLLAATLLQVEQQRQALQLRLEEPGDGLRILGEGISLQVRPWSFGERNDALRRSMRLENDQLKLDLTLYERLMVLRCVTLESGGRLEPADLSDWPVPLGELVLSALDRLNGIESAYAETMAAAVRESKEHPDLALIHLCRTFGWSPDQVLKLDAVLAERLLIGVRELERSGLLVPAGALSAAPGATPTAAALAAYHSPESLLSVPPGYAVEGVTRIVVTDD